MKIYKSTFTVTVYSNEPLRPDLDLPDILQDCDTGECICGIAVGPETILTDPAQIEAALIAIGNDGTFFANHDDIQENS